MRQRAISSLRGFCGAAKNASEMRPPRMAPRIGAIQKSQSWLSAQPPAKRAGPVLRAGLTEVLVTGMLMRWMRVRQRPMAMGANPFGARSSVEPRLMR